MRGLKAVSLTVALATAVACGNSEAEKKPEEAAKQARIAAEAMQKAAESATGAATSQGAVAAAQGMEAFAKAMQAAGAAVSKDGKPIDPVSFQQLETALPVVAGWERAKPRGEKMNMPVAFSQTKATYKSGRSVVAVKIVDSAFSQMLIAPWTMFLTAGFERQTSEGYQKSVTVGGSPGFEKWDDADKDGELNLVVAKRFLVTIEGRRIDDTKVLHDFAANLDTGKLGALR